MAGRPDSSPCKEASIRRSTCRYIPRHSQPMKALTKSLCHAFLRSNVRLEKGIHLELLPLAPLRHIRPDGQGLVLLRHMLHLHREHPPRDLHHRGVRELKEAGKELLRQRFGRRILASIRRVSIENQAFWTLLGTDPADASPFGASPT